MAPQRIRFFLWLVGHDRIMKNSNRMRHNLTSDPSCKHCNVEETTLHLLWDCKTAKKIWQQIVLNRDLNSFFTPPLWHWLSLNLNPPVNSNHKWSTTCTITLWRIWRWRNIKCFENPSFEPWKPFEFIMTQSNTITKAMKSSSKIDVLLKSEKLIRWMTPPDD